MRCFGKLKIIKLTRSYWKTYALRTEMGFMTRHIMWHERAVQTNSLPVQTFLVLFRKKRGQYFQSKRFQGILYNGILPNRHTTSEKVQITFHFHRNSTFNITMICCWKSRSLFLKYLHSGAWTSWMTKHPIEFPFALASSPYICPREKARQILFSVGGGGGDQFCF